MDPLHFCIAVLPLIVYALLLGLINLWRKPFLTTGARDIAAIGIAASGLAIVGPMELFLPEAAANRFGGWVWLLLIAFYGLCISLSILLMRPRLVIYNTTLDQIRPILVNIASQIDKDGRWAGDSLTLPNLGIQVHLETFSPLRNVQIVSSGPNQNFEGWRYLEKELSAALKGTRNRPNFLGLALIVMATGVAISTSVWMFAEQQAVAQALNEMLRR